MATATKLDLRNIHLESGGHSPTGGEVCAMELVAYVAGETWSDRPTCTSPVIGAYLRRMNDRLDDDRRQRLLPYLVVCDDTGKPILADNGHAQPGPVVGTNTGKEDDETRVWMCMDWLVHEYFPAMLRFAGLTEHAEALEQLVTITSRSVYDSVRPIVRSAIDAAYDKGSSWRERVRRAVAGAGAVADADAVADAGTVADAGADAGAVAVADAGADADAVAVADAGAVAVAGAGADRVIAEAITAATAAKRDGGNYWAQRGAAYTVFRPYYDRLLSPVSEGLLTSSLQLLDRMIQVGKSDAEAA